MTFLKVQSISINTLCFWYREPCDDGTQGVTGEEDPKHIRHAQLLWVREIIEQDAGQDGTEFASGGTDAVSEATNAGREDLARHDECCGIGAKVEEQLQGLLTFPIAQDGRIHLPERS